MEGGGGWAGSVLVTTKRPGPPPLPGMSGQAEPGKKHRCQLKPPRKKNSGVGGTDRWDAPSYHAPCPISVLKSQMGKGAGLEGVFLAPGPTMPEPLIKRGAYQAGCLESILPAGPPSQGAVSGPDKPCRMIPFRRAPEEEGVGGREVFWCQQISQGQPSSIKSRKR